MPAPFLPLGAMAIGAAVMFWLDPRQGRRRRALVRDKIVSGLADLDDAFGVVTRDMGNRARGIVAATRSRVRKQDVSDAVLTERVRARLGRVVSHPGAIQVSASQGRVTLGGAVLQSEHAQLLRTVRSVSGVHDVEDRTAVYESADGIPALQGGVTPPGERFDLMQENWSPAARALTGALGGTLLYFALTDREHRGFNMLPAAIGTALLLRSSTNMPLRRMTGFAAGREAIHVQKTIHVNAPVEQVFDALSHYENFPRFMSNVREVHVREDGVSQWTVAGPAGAPVHWNAITTRLEPNRLLAWRTLPGSMVEHEGAIRLEAEDGGTRVEITMRYTPPAGALGHAVAKLFGSDPKTEFDEDLMRMKMFIETGRPPRDAAAARH